MKKILTIFFVVFVFISINFAQARKIDEFGPVTDEDLQSRLSTFVDEVSNDSTAKAQFLIYAGEKDTFGFPYRLGASIVSFLARVSKVKKEDVLITVCQSEQFRRVESWIVKEEVDLRACQNNLPSLVKTTLFDSIYYINESPEVIDSYILIQWFDEEEYVASLKAFAELIKNNPSSKAYIYLYLGTNVVLYSQGNQKIRRIRNLDSTKMLRAMSQTTNKILNEKGIDSSRFVLINGGYKDSTRNIELWLVPKGEKPPKPKPNFFPKKK